MRPILQTLQKFAILTLCTLVSLTGCVDQDSDLTTGPQPSLSSCVPADELKSYYTPLFGTLNLHWGVIPCEDADVVGTPLDKAAIVLNEVGQYISRIAVDGSTSWTFASPDHYILDLRIVNGDVQFIQADDLVTLDAVTGNEKYRETIGYARCYDGRVRCLDDGVFVIQTEQKIPAVYPRAAVIHQNIVYVADTFGHRVIAYDLQADHILWMAESYYPNSVQVIGSRLIIAEEHANRISSLDLTTGAKSKLYACEIDAYSDPNKNIDEIQTRERTGDLTRLDGRSVCEGLLYSPNYAALQGDGTLLIGDTDNHRVLHVDASGNTIREIRNLNNPIQAYLVDP